MLLLICSPKQIRMTESSWPNPHVVINMPSPFEEESTFPYDLAASLRSVEQRGAVDRTGGSANSGPTRKSRSLSHQGPLRGHARTGHFVDRGNHDLSDARRNDFR